MNESGVADHENSFEWDMSEETEALIPALIAAQGECENAKTDATNPLYKSKYATLESVLDAVKPCFKKHGLAIVQMPGDAGSLNTLILHKSGQWLACRSTTPLGKQDPQGVGSALTYLRRYSLAAIAAIAQEDDDGNAAIKTSADPRSQRPPATPNHKLEDRLVESIIVEQVKKINACKTANALKWHQKKFISVLSPEVQAALRLPFEQHMKHIQEGE